MRLRHPIDTRPVNTRGVTARENCTCCGFVYFPTQCTQSAAAGQGRTLLYGGFDGSAGLSAQWDGDPGKAIEGRPLTWHRRLVG